MKYEYKDAVMLMKEISKIADSIYKNETDKIVRQLENTTDGKHRCRFGLLSLRRNSAKTIKVYTDSEKEEIMKLQAEIDKLQARIDCLGTTQIIADEYNSLVCTNNAVAQNEANDILADVIATIGNASISRANKKLNTH